MKYSRNILALVVLATFVITLGGCSGGADSLLEINAKILPKTRLYVGKNAKGVEEKAIDATNTRAAIDNGVITTAAELEAREAGF